MLVMKAEQHVCGRDLQVHNRRVGRRPCPNPRSLPGWTPGGRRPAAASAAQGAHPLTASQMEASSKAVGDVIHSPRVPLGVSVLAPNPHFVSVLPCLV